MNRRYLDVALALALTPACGVDPSAIASASMSPGSVQHQDALEEETSIDEDEEDESALTGTTLARVRQTYSALKSNGSLDDRNWRQNEMPPSSQRYARVELENDAQGGVFDGYNHSALVPLTSDGSAKSQFYVMREGGVAGWEFLAGPFNMASQVVYLGEQNAGQAVNVGQGDRVVVDLPSNPASGYAWSATSTLTHEQEQQFAAPSPRAWSTTRFVWDTEGLATGDTHVIRLQYKRAGDSRAMRDLSIAVNVR